MGEGLKGVTDSGQLQPIIKSSLFTQISSRSLPCYPFSMFPFFSFLNVPVCLFVSLCLRIDPIPSCTIIHFTIFNNSQNLTILHTFFNLPNTFIEHKTKELDEYFQAKKKTKKKIVCN